MGMTGTGKSSFIKLLTGDEGVKVGETLEPETSEIKSFLFFHNHQCVSLVDTPGFDDSRPNMSDSKLLDDIAEFLKRRHHTKAVHGFMYFHRIRDVRVGGAATRNIRMFSSLCGPEAMKNVAIVTTRWDELHGEQQLQAAGKTEKELLGHHFEDFIDGQAQVHRHDNTLESAQAVMSSLLRCPPIGDIRVVVEILHGKTLPETDAGLELKEQLVQLVSHYEDELKRLSIEFQAAIKFNKEAHEEEVAKLRMELEKVKKDHEALLGKAKRVRTKRREVLFRVLTRRRA
ncbi:uncharacterized protein LACBIDRAFT_298189 [Laccaria bicolor S238N-H82]|uniref:Predicted protein n=1 Tax=Laccaria bicolor (strain S238N-H82 / ATCC MYA-4686) TaxID=486041 RepID=B0DCF3_LACBS|nr:uncharacterized protein LACBIDRAFT_298189 [Laccaria bicolor S238N-H82]EDR07720.1 predicted protein [Laccaria bicolor S238N-H82]|eukprot:XP_001881509.1 predicted protein [Laccaria bicolor S238N-H82]